ncbi:3,4-dihydroxy-2-butanone-4-phosphate synthase [Rhodococcus sp. 14-2483-1-2]|uniref:3,4-dihydroxy-2-butanone-4-phosphate synthase n=1 Tax=Rhodococcus sp. 14-2483-1-2 TaxID=2023147 RepID=UPI000B9A5543|nr:3,4-dihydroxy-2-butanone-4-phosphate synthase [Rhodococcus sp. 14-2483-1-2]OZF27243.1 bifunctional 3,4-dihydroxy-2-butanone-4-phosphate synthase/GTP cyclohydrolase II [Rhodococcus sp. 14-2483-1-2]
MTLDSISLAVSTIRSGGIVVVLDDADRENEADLVMAAEFASEDAIAFFLQHTSGFICAPIDSETQSRLGLPRMTQINTELLGTAFLVSVDAARSTTTGISAGDRAATLRALAHPDTVGSDLNRPGHVLPLLAKPGGVLERRGHTEAAVDLCLAAGLRPVAVICELVTEDKRRMLAGEGAEEFARAHGLPVVSIDDLASYRRNNPASLCGRARIPLRGSVFDILSYRSRHRYGAEHIALVLGEVTGGEAAVAVRVHSECATGDIFGSERCDCGAQLDLSLAEIIERGRGVIVYLRGHEGRGIGLAAKLRAYELQDSDGLDTVEANLAQGLPADARRYDAAAEILEDLGVGSVDLLTNNPDKLAALRQAGVDVVHRTPVIVSVTDSNVRYLRSKADRMGHLLPPVLPVSFSP